MNQSFLSENTTVSTVIEKRKRFAQLAVAVIIADSLVSGLPLANYVFGLAALAFYPVAAFEYGMALVSGMALLSTGIALIIGGFANLFALVIPITLPGLILSKMMLKRESPSKVIIWSFLPAFVLVILFLLNKAEYEADFNNAIKGTIADFPQLFSGKGNAEQSMLSYGRAVFSLIPALMLLSELFNVLIGYWVGRKVLLKSGYGYNDVPTLPPFSAWRPDYRLVGLFITGLFFTVLQLGGSDYIGWNVLAFTGIIYFISGLAVVENFFRRSKIPIFFKLLFYLGIFFAQLFSLVVLAGVGLFDSWFNFRNRRVEKKV